MFYQLVDVQIQQIAEEGFHVGARTMVQFRKTPIIWLNSERFQNSFSSLNCHFCGKITKMITRVNDSDFNEFTLFMILKILNENIGIDILENFEKRLEDREPCHYICTKQDGWLRPGGLAAIRRIVSDDIKSTKNEIKKDLANKLSSY